MEPRGLDTEESDLVVEDGRRLLVQKLQDNVRSAKRHFEKDFLRIKKDQDLIPGETPDLCHGLHWLSPYLWPTVTYQMGSLVV